MSDSVLILTDDLIEQAETYLRRNDKKLAALIEKFGPCPLRPRTRYFFDVLASAVISQQLSTGAAQSIKSRIERVVGRKRPFRPRDFLVIQQESLRSSGLSSAKTRCLTSLAADFTEGRISPGLLRSLNNNAVKEQLIKFRGVGPWTAEMFLIFALGRADVCSVSDAGLKRAARLLYGCRNQLSEKRFENLTTIWHPYRSVASWYLWRLLD